MQTKHYELLATRVIRYIQALEQIPARAYDSEEIGKAIAVIYELIQREAERDYREQANQAQGETK